MKLHPAILVLLLSGCSDGIADPSSPTADGGATPDAATTPDASPDPEAPDAAPPNTDELDAKCTPGFDLELLDNDPGRQALFLDSTGGDPEAFVQDIGRTVCRILYKAPAEVRNATHLTLRIEHAVGEVAWKAGDGADITVMISTDHLQNVDNDGDDVAREVKGILLHEMTHMYQHDDHDGNGADGGLIEGIADFVRIKAGYTPRGAQPSGQGNWNDGYTRTAFFLIYVDGLVTDFAHDLNLSMDSEDGQTWTPEVFVDITGKTADQLWDAYRDSL